MAWTYLHEVARKGVHLLSTLFIIIYILASAFFGHKIGLLVLAFVLVVFLEIEYVRVEMKTKIPIISHLWRLKRSKEQDQLGGEVFFLIGTIICLAIFDVRVAITAVLMTTFGDMVAALVGKKFGKHKLLKFKKRSWEGTIAELIVNLIVGYLFMRTIVNGSIWWLGGSWGAPIWPVIIVMAVTATIVEVIVHKFDDNLLIPIFTGFNGQIMLLILAYFF